jgi:hypothetical protein
MSCTTACGYKKLDASDEHDPQAQIPLHATLSQEHDSNVWALMFHPLRHLLVSTSSGHATRFWDT